MHRFLRGTTWLPGSKSFPSQNTEKSWDPISSQFKPKGGEFPGLWAKSQAHRVPRRRGGADNWDNARAMARRLGWAPASKGGCILGLCYWRHVWRSLAGATRGWARFGLSRRKRNLMLSSRSSSKLLTCRNKINWFMWSVVFLVATKYAHMPQQNRHVSESITTELLSNTQPLG